MMMINVRFDNKTIKNIVKHQYETYYLKLFLSPVKSWYLIPSLIIPASVCLCLSIWQKIKQFSQVCNYFWIATDRKHITHVSFYKVAQRKREERTLFYHQSHRYLEVTTSPLLLKGAVACKRCCVIEKHSCTLSSQNRGRLCSYIGTWNKTQSGGVCPVACWLCIAWVPVSSPSVCREWPDVSAAC